uniref:Caveolin n=1 Tax=Trichuris muris TaxID=70415 RepID=A0A5S6R1N2_TRIMR
MLINKHVLNTASESGTAIAQIDVAYENVYASDCPAGNHMQSSSRATSMENGMTITTVSPVSGKCGVFSVATFDPRRIPKAIISENVQITVEDYVDAMKRLIGDSRFRVYRICHQRVVLAWILCGFLLMGLLLVCGAYGITLFALIVAWMILMCIGVGVSLFVNKRLCKNIAVCVAAVNKFLSQFDLLLCVDDRGKFSCNSVTIVFVRFNLRNCLARTCSLLSQYSIVANRRQLNISSVSSNVDISTEKVRQEQARSLLFRYSQQYCRDLVRGVVRLPVSRVTETNDLLAPLHCAFAQCLCQYVERNFFMRRERFRWSAFCL